MEKEIDKTKVSRIEHVLASVKRHNPLEPDPDVTFEFMMASCFPSIWNNIQEKLKNEYNAGYLDGVEVSKNLKDE